MLKKASVFNFFLKTFYEFIVMYIGKRVLNGDLIKMKMCCDVVKSCEFDYYFTAGAVLGIILRR